MANSMRAFPGIGVDHQVPHLGETSFVYSQGSFYLEWNSTASDSNPVNLIILKILVQTSEKNFTHNSCQKPYTPQFECNR